VKDAVDRNCSCTRTFDVDTTQNQGGAHVALVAEEVLLDLGHRGHNARLTAQREPQQVQLPPNHRLTREQNKHKRRRCASSWCGVQPTAMTAAVATVSTPRVFCAWPQNVSATPCIGGRTVTASVSAAVPAPQQ
jgi:hypothetical protein